MEGDKITLTQLKEVLKRLGLSPKGNKPELLKRLYEHDPAGTWKQWVGKISADGMEEGTTMQQNTKERDGTETEEMQRRGALRSPSRQEVEAKESLRDREIEIFRRERDLMRRELEILHREREKEAHYDFAHDDVSQNSTMRLQPKTLSELLSEFSDTEDTFHVWRKQFELIRPTYLPAR